MQLRFQRLRHYTSKLLPGAIRQAVIAASLPMAESAVPLHLLYVFPEPLPLPRARGVQVAHFVQALARVGVMVTLAYVPAENDGHPFSPIGIEIPANVRLLPLSRRLPFPFRQFPLQSHHLFMGRLGRWIKAAKRTGKAPDVVFFRHVKAAYQFSKALPGLPFVFESHEVFAETAKASQRSRIAAMEREVLSRAALVIANSEGSAAGISRVHGLDRPVLVLPNGVDYPERIPAKDWSDARSRIIYAGSLFGWKGVDDLVDAMAFLEGHRVLIVGGSQEQIERLQQRQPPGGELVFAGQIPQYKVQEYLRSACVAVLPNRPDPDSQFTSPLKLFEYMAAGCAVVSTDLPSLREVLGDNDAFWATPSNPQSLAAAISRACGEPAKARELGERARVLVRTRTWENRARQLLEKLQVELQGGK